MQIAGRMILKRRPICNFHFSNFNVAPNEGQILFNDNNNQLVL